MRKRLIKVGISILIVSMLLISCSSKNNETSLIDDNTASVNEAKVEEVNNIDEVEEVEDTGEGDVDISLIDRALLEGIKIKWPESLKMKSTEDSNGVLTNITTYQRNFSTREERESDGETIVEIYDADKGITYEYTKGATDGIMRFDDEYDIELLEDDKALEGKSLIALFEGVFEEDTLIKAKSIKMLGRKAVEIEIGTGNEEEGEKQIPWKFVIDSKYAVALKGELVFGDGYYLFTETTEIEFNIKLDDSLFEPPKDVTFSE